MTEYVNWAWERCVCGSQIEVRSPSPGTLENRLREWRQEHRHERIVPTQPTRYPLPHERKEDADG